jgi:hypothetical protein
MCKLCIKRKYIEQTTYDAVYVASMADYSKEKENRLINSFTYFQENVNKRIIKPTEEDTFEVFDLNMKPVFLEGSKVLETKTITTDNGTFIRFYVNQAKVGLYYCYYYVVEQ